MLCRAVIGFFSPIPVSASDPCSLLSFLHHTAAIHSRPSMRSAIRLSTPSCDYYYYVFLSRLRLTLRVQLLFCETIVFRLLKFISAHFFLSFLFPSNSPYCSSIAGTYIHLYHRSFYQIVVVFFPLYLFMFVCLSDLTSLPVYLPPLNPERSIFDPESDFGLFFV